MKSYTIQDYVSSKAEEWNEFVEDSNNGTVFHRQDFLSYHPEGRFARDDKLVYEGRKLVAVLPLSYEAAGDGSKVGRSPYGASFGGVVHKELSAKRAHILISCLRERLKADGYSMLHACFPPACYWKACDSTVEYVLLKEVKHRCVGSSLTSVIELHNRLSSQSYRRSSRGAQKAGVTVQRSSDIDTFYELLCETIVEKHGSQITHTREELKLLLDLLGDRLQIFLGMYGGKAISGVLVFENASPCAMAFYNGHRQEFADLNSLNMVLDHVVACFAADKNFLDLGTTDAFDASYNWGLFQFKEGAGGRGYCRNYYEFCLD